MKTRLKKGLIVAATSGLLLSGAALVGAQQSTDTPADTPLLAQHGMRGAPGGFDRMQGGPGGFGFMPGLATRGDRMLTEGSTVDVIFYDADPAQGGTELSSYSLTVGNDSEVSFAQNVREAIETAAFATVKVSEQSRTIELAGTDTAVAKGFGFRGVPLRGLTEGSTLEALFYDGNPEEGATATTTLSFTAGTDSELAFDNAFQEAAASASYVTINTSAQERTVDLSQVKDRMDAFMGQAGYGQRGFGPGNAGPGGFGPGMHRGHGHFGPDNANPDITPPATDETGSPNT